MDANSCFIGTAEKHAQSNEIGGDSSGKQRLTIFYSIFTKTII